MESLYSDRAVEKSMAALIRSAQPAQDFSRADARAGGLASPLSYSFAMPSNIFSLARRSSGCALKAAGPEELQVLLSLFRKSRFACD
jgi:hypothetical protein